MSVNETYSRVGAGKHWTDIILIDVLCICYDFLL